MYTDQDKICHVSIHLSSLSQAHLRVGCSRSFWQFFSGSVTLMVSTY